MRQQGDHETPVPGPPRSVPTTGPGEPGQDGAVAEALARLEGLDDAPLRDHVAAFEVIHESLQRQLTEPADERGGV
ncbi:hypothetical protein [Oerskovia flava]|uniref:hypothetical protein n=1 Tax=Oerskovia flava TaxID=2986422 RepID=UPI00223F3B0D|nr:hypothetical protein [Oerskovia sp. JB1-3-2]